MPGRPDRTTLRAQLRALITEFALRHQGAIADDTPLISSALVESVTLLNVALWVEQQIDYAVDITAFDLSVEWDTVTDILNFIEKHRSPSPALEFRWTLHWGA